jgi:signal transduction histidine kinase
MTMKKFSLNRRLIVAAVASQLLLTAGLVIVGTTFCRMYIQRGFNVYLEGRAQSVAALVYYPDDGSTGLLFNDAKIPPSDQHGHRELFQVVSDHGDFERHTAGFDPQIFSSIPKDARFWDFHQPGVHYHAIVLRDVAILDTEEGIPLPLPKLTVVYAAPTGEIEHEMAELGITIGIVSLLIMIPTLVLMLWSMRRALRPLHDLTAAAAAISVDSWSFEPSESARSTRELEPLIAALGTVLAGLEAAFIRQREFLGDATHELKTSLAILKSTLQSLLTKPRNREEYESGLTMMNRDCDRLERLLNRMLQSARAEQRIASGAEHRADFVDLASSCEGAIAQLAQFAAAREIVVEFNANGEALLQADLADLELIWLNLLENAIQYSPRGSTVVMTLAAQPDSVSVSVVDKGCGIEPVHLPKIFERFYRADSSRARATGGFGLGLAIAKSLVNFYGGQIHAESQPGVGTSMIVTFPLDSATGAAAKYAVGHSADAVV